MKSFKATAQSWPRIAMAVVAAGLFLAGCETTGSGAGVGTVGGAALGAGASRAVFGNSTSAMLIGGAVGGLAGNMTLDRQAEVRAAEEREASRDRSAQRQLDFERQRTIQQFEVERELEERRLFDEWRRDQGR